MSPSVELKPELEAVLRAQLRAGEEVVWARTPRMRRDLWRVGRIGRFDTPTVVAGAMTALMTVALAHWAVNEIRGIADPLSGPVGGVFCGFLLLQGAVDLVRSRGERRGNDGTICAVTTERVLRIGTVPELRVEAWDATQLAGVSWRPEPAARGPAVGNIRFLKGVTSHEGNAFMRVTAPEACAAAIGALLAPTSTRTVSGAATGASTGTSTTTSPPLVPSA